MLRRRLHGLVEDKSKPEMVRRCAVVLRELARHKLSGVFLFPMDRLQVPEYYAVIEQPITVLSLLEHLERWSPVGGTGPERVAGEAGADVELVDGFTISVRRMWENCWSYNHEGTEVSLAVVTAVSFLPRGRLAQQLLHGLTVSGLDAKAHTFVGWSTPVCVGERGASFGV